MDQDYIILQIQQLLWGLDNFLHVHFLLLQHDQYLNQVLTFYFINLLPGLETLIFFKFFGSVLILYNGAYNFTCDTIFRLHVALTGREIFRYLITYVDGNINAELSGN